MTPSTSRKVQRVYRYYRCSGRHSRGKSCPSRPIQAERIEQFVVDRIKDIGKNPELVEETLRQVTEAKKAKRDVLVAEKKRLRRELAKNQKEARRLLDIVTSDKVPGSTITDRLTDHEEQIAKLELRTTEISDELVVLSQSTISQTDLVSALSLFDPIWELLYPPERARIIQILIERIDYNGRAGKLVIEFAPTGIKALVGEMD